MFKASEESRYYASSQDTGYLQLPKRDFEDDVSSREGSVRSSSIALDNALTTVGPPETSRYWSEDLDSYHRRRGKFQSLPPVKTLTHPTKVRPEYLSDHAIRLHFSYTQTSFAQGINCARRPWGDYHSFASVPDPNPTTTSTPSFSCLVSKAGDWTSAAIVNPPTHLWVRAIPGTGFGYAALLFRKVLIVATGSGMGPCMSLLVCAERPPLHILWSARAPRRTYGDGILSLMAAADPNAVVVDTTVHARQDMVALAWDAELCRKLCMRLRRGGYLRSGRCLIRSDGCGVVV